MVVSQSKLIRIGEYVRQRLDTIRTAQGKTYSYDTALHILLREYDDLLKNKKQ